MAVSPTTLSHGIRTIFRSVALPLLSSLALVACTETAPAHTPAATTTTSAVKASSSQNVLDTAVKADGPGCSAAVGVEGKVAWH